MVSFLKKRKFILTLLFSGGIFIALHASVFALEIGDKVNFFVDPIYDFKNRTEVSATLRNISENVYFYIEDDYWNSLSFNEQNLYLESINDVAEQFDTITYPILHYVFGSEWKPGIDNDERLTILFTNLKVTAGGYFNSKDEIPKSDEDSSNEREMLYIGAVQIRSPLIDSFIAHEFQHLISWNEKERVRNLMDDVWLNELRSEYSPPAAGYDSAYSGTTLDRRVNDFLANPFDSLTEWQGDRFDYPPVI